MNNLLEFYGHDCEHCARMRPLVERLEKEEGVKVERLEVYENDENYKTMQQYDKDFCGGVPFFYNTKSNKWICGEEDYENLKKWAKGE